MRDEGNEVFVRDNNVCGVTGKGCYGKCGGWYRHSPMGASLQHMGTRVVQALALATPALPQFFLPREALGIQAGVHFGPRQVRVASCILAKVLVIDHARRPLKLLAGLRNQRLIAHQIRQPAQLVGQEHSRIQGI